MSGLVPNDLFDVMFTILSYRVRLTLTAFLALSEIKSTQAITLLSVVRSGVTV